MGLSAHQRNGGHDEWLTPPEILRALGAFDLDPCAPVVRPWETAARHYTVQDDGLALPWKGRVWCNPPFGREAVKWLRRMRDHGNGVALIPARTETEMFYETVWGAADGVLFLKGRPHFHYVDGRRAAFNSGAPIALVAYGEANLEALMHSGLGFVVVGHNAEVSGLAPAQDVDVEPVAFLFKVLKVGKGRLTEFAALDYEPLIGEKIIRKDPLYLATPSAPVPEGCTPEDARVLREANHALASESSELQTMLADLLQQIEDHCVKYGEADFYTGDAQNLMNRLNGLPPAVRHPSAPVQAVPDWQPIETAPDERGIDVWIRSTENPDYGVRVTGVHRVGGKWYGIPPMYLEAPCYLSHWMFPPQPPKESTAQSSAAACPTGEHK